VTTPGGRNPTARFGVVPSPARRRISGEPSGGQPYMAYLLLTLALGLLLARFMAPRATAR
jgi:hypothetical protein